MKLYLLLILVKASVSSFACSCLIMPDFKTREDLKDYDFIALAKITGLSVANTNTTANRRSDGEIKIDIIDQFKGTMQGAINEPDVNSSCDLGLDVGEEWLFFGSKGKDKIEVSMCSYTMRYRNAAGWRNWHSLAAIGRLSKLQDLYNKRKAERLQALINYENGKPEVRQTIKNGELHGIRTIYYPTGQIYIQEMFSKGKRIGYRKIFAPSGQLTDDVRYADGRIKNKTSYYDSTQLKVSLNMDTRVNAESGEISAPDDPLVQKTTDSLYRAAIKNGRFVNFKVKFTNHGKSYTQKEYDRLGKLTGRSYVDTKKHRAEFYKYYHDGTIQSYRKLDARQNVQISNEYNKNQPRRDFLMPCNACEIYFDAKYDNGSKPEEIYLQ